MKIIRWFIFLLLLVIARPLFADTNRTFTIGAFNVENWNQIERRKKPDQPKPTAEKEAVVTVLTTAQPDVLGIEEMGKTNDLAEFRGLLAAKGLNYPHWEWVQGVDPDRHVCLLSRFPIVSRQSRTDYSYFTGGQPHSISRGLLDVTIQVNPQYSFRAIVVHLKSKRQTDFGDQANMRLEEAKLLRGHINKILKQDTHANLITMGDFNDTPDTPPITAVITAGPLALFPLPCKTTKGYEGTHFWRAKSEWSRIDYLMTSPGMSNEFVEGTAKIYEGHGAGEASDHRLIYAQFHDHDIGPAPAVPATINWPPIMRIALIILAIVVVVLIVLLYLTYRQKQK